MKRKLIGFVISILILSGSYSQAISRDNPEKWAIMFVDQDLMVESVKTLQERVSMSIPMAKDRLEYEAKGYRVFVAYAEDQTILNAILDGRVKSISYYGHGGGSIPMFGDRDANSWKQAVFMHLLTLYREKGYSQEEAYNSANRESMNFGFWNVINRSCGSLFNSSLADQFVAPGGSYYGVRAKRYYPCNPLTALFSTSDWTLDEYRREESDEVLGNKFILREGGTSGTCVKEGSLWRCTFSSGTVSVISNIAINGNKITMTRKDENGRYHATADYEGVIKGKSLHGKRFWKPKNGKGVWGEWSATIIE